MRLLLTPLALGALALLAPGCGPPQPDPRIQAALDAFAPGLPIGRPISDDARRRYRLRVAPYLGYADSTFRTADGLDALVVRLDRPPLDEADPRLSGRVVAVALRAPDAASAARAERRLREALGAPEEACFVSEESGSRWRQLWWAGVRGRGVEVMVRRSPTPEEGLAAFGSALVTFGAEEPAYTARREPCA